MFPQDVDDPDAAAYIRPGEIKQLLNKNFYFASTRKTPSLTQEDVKKLIHTLRGKQTESTCAE